MKVNGPGTKLEQAAEEIQSGTDQAYMALYRLILTFSS